MNTEYIDITFETLKARVKVLEDFIAAKFPGFPANPVDASTADDAPAYLWRDQRVTFVSPIQREGEALAWVKIGTGDPIIVAVGELKPMKESDK